MASYICAVCGEIYDEEKEGVKFSDLPDDWRCPKCGAINIHSDNAHELVEMEIKSKKKVEQYSNNFCFIWIAIGIIITIISFSALLSANTNTFISAVCGLLIVFFGILGLIKKEPVSKGVFIAIIIALFNLFFSFAI